MLDTSQEVSQPLHIVLDANIIIKEDYGNSLHFDLLLSDLRRRQHNVYVPELALEEVVAHFSRWLNSDAEKMSKSLSKVSRRLSLNLQSPLAEFGLQELECMFRQQLQQKFDSPDIAILNYPDVSHEHLVKKATERKRPFNDRGSGYRDALIWESVLVGAAKIDAKIILISADKDFRETGDKDKLHPDLIKDLEKRRLDKDKVVLVRSIAEFIDRHMRPYLKELSKEHPIEVLRDRGINLEDEVAIAVQDTHSSQEWGPGEFDLDAEIDSLRLDSVQDLYSLDVVDVRVMNDRDLLIKMGARLICEFEAFVDKASWYSIQEDTILTLLDPDWNRHCGLASVTLELDCTFDTTIGITDLKKCRTQILAVKPVPRSADDLSFD